MSDFSNGKSIFVLAIVAGCFAILWPNVFSPMFHGLPPEKILEEGVDKGGSGCCDVIFDNDVNVIKLASELCERVLANEHNYDRDYALYLQQGKLTKTIVNTCQKAVLKQCSIDITSLLSEKVNLGRSYKQLVDDMRSLNSSLCLKHTFGISFGTVGLPRLMRVWGINQPKHMHQERPPHLRPDFLHPALREKGRAIPQSHIVPKIVKEGRPGPIPGLRPPMGGAGHVVPPPKGGSTMGIVMPMYTVGIVIFFLYTMMKLIFKKSDVSSSYEVTPDIDFQHSVFGDASKKNYDTAKDAYDDSKLVVSAITGLVEEVNRQIRSDQAHLLAKAAPTQELQTKDEGDVVEESTPNDEELDVKNKEDEDEDESGKGKVKVLGMEMTESCEKGARWSRPSTPQNRTVVPQNIYIAGPLTASSKLLVSDSHTETLPAEDHAVVLTGKVTLSLIGLESVESDMPVLSENGKPKEVETNTMKHDERGKPKIEAETCDEFTNGTDGDDSESDEFESDVEESPVPKELHN